MPDRSVRFVLTGDSAGAVRAMQETAAATDAAAAEMSSKMDEASGKTGGFLAKLSSGLGNIPIVGTAASKAVDGVAAKFDQASTTGQKFSTAMSAVGGATLAMAGTGLVAAGAASIKMASDFQSSMTQLVTGAGESEKNIKAVGQGILDMAGEVGQTPQQLAAGMFLIESAGFHGAAGLTVLKSAAEGAATGGAQMSTVADALTTAMHDYNIPTGQANNVTSALIETVASGKTHLEDLASSLGKVMPQAAALGINFQTVTGAMATMTNAGLSARLASMHLSNTLLSMSAPSSAAVKAMQDVGLSSQQVKDTLDGPGGLSAALKLIEDHVGSKFPAGSVASVNAFKTIMGGATGYSTALMLTGANSATFESNVKAIGDRLDGSSKSVQGFSQVQGDLSFQMQQAKATVDALAIKFGEALIPKVEMAAHALSDIISWFEKNKLAAEVLGGVIATVLGAAVTVFAYNKAKAFVTAIQGMAQDVGKLATKLIAFVTPTEEAGAATEAMSTNMQLSFAEAGTAEEAFATTSEETGAAASSAFGPIGIAVMAVVAVGTLLATHWSQVKAVLDAVWDGIKSAAVAVWDFIKDHLGIVIPVIATLMTGPIGGAVALIVTHWNTVKSATLAVWGDIVNFFTGIPGKITGAISALGSDIAGVATAAWNAFKGAVVAGWNAEVSFWTGLPGKILAAVGDGASLLVHWGEGIVQGIVHGIVSAAKDIGSALVNAVKSGVDMVKNAVNSIPIVGGVLSAIGLAEGGIVNKPTFALLGEGTGPEAVLPLNDPQRIQEILAASVPFVPGGAAALGVSGSSAGPTAASSGGGLSGAQIIQNLNVTENSSPRELAYAFSLELKAAGL